MKVMENAKLLQAHLKIINVISRMGMKCIILILARIHNILLKTLLQHADIIPDTSLHILIREIRRQFSHDHLKPVLRIPHTADQAVLLMPVIIEQIQDNRNCNSDKNEQKFIENK